MAGFSYQSKRKQESRRAYATAVRELVIRLNKIHLTPILTLIIHLNNKSFSLVLNPNHNPRCLTLTLILSA